jgi:chromosome partitioning protein
MAVINPTRISQQVLKDAEARVSALLMQYQDALLKPESKKTPPTFVTSQIADLCNITMAQAAYRILKQDVPIGLKRASNSSRYFEVKDVQEWVRLHRPERLKPEQCYAITIAIANFKGGVAKSTTTMTLAQGLSLRGHKVLVIDSDAQGSLTSLFGLMPFVGVPYEQTLGPLFDGEEKSVAYAIQQSYWPGIDLIASNLELYNAEFVLPVKQREESTFEFWNVLNNGLDYVRENYDVILIDTSPALSYVTTNVLAAADGIIIPMPPDMLTFTSSAGFMKLLNELLEMLYSERGKSKSFSFVDVLLTKVEGEDATLSTIREWIKTVYGPMLLPVEIPKTSVATTSSAELGTIYDMVKGQIDSRTYKRAYQAYDQFVTLIESQIIHSWNNQGVDYGDI